MGCTCAHKCAPSLPPDHAKLTNRAVFHGHGAWQRKLRKSTLGILWSLKIVEPFPKILPEFSLKYPKIHPFEVSTSIVFHIFRAAYQSPQYYHHLILEHRHPPREILYLPAVKLHFLPSPAHHWSTVSRALPIPDVSYQWIHIPCALSCLAPLTQRSCLGGSFIHSHCGTLSVLHSFSYLSMRP